MRDSSDILVPVSESVAHELLTRAAFEIDGDGCWVLPSDARVRTGDTGEALRLALVEIVENRSRLCC